MYLHVFECVRFDTSNSRLADAVACVCVHRRMCMCMCICMCMRPYVNVRARPCVRVCVSIREWYWHILVTNMYYLQIQ